MANIVSVLPASFTKARLLPNRSLVAWGTRRIALGAWIFHSNTFHFICWAAKFSAFSFNGPFKLFLRSNLVRVHLYNKIQDWILKSKESENGFCASLPNRSIQDLLDHGASKEPKNPLPDWILRFLWRTMIRNILDWSV